MSKKKSFKNFFKNYIFNITFISVFLISVAVCALIISLVTIYVKNNQVKKVESYATSIASEVETTLTTKLNSLHIMEEYIAYIDSTTVDSKFDKIAKRIVESNPDISYITFAKDNKISYIYPYSGHSVLYGSSYEQLTTDDEFKKASDNSTFYISYSNLVEDNKTILMGCLPIYLDKSGKGEEYWGLATIVLDYKSTFESIKQSLDETFELRGYVCKICEVDSATGKETIVCETENSFNDNSAVYGLSKVNTKLYGSDWVIYAAPYFSANDKLNYSLAAIAVFIISVAIGIGYVAYRRVIEERLNKELEVKTEIIEKQNKEVQQSHDLLQILASEYQALYLVNVADGIYERYSIDETMLRSIGNKFDGIKNYNDAIDVYVEYFVSDGYKLDIKKRISLKNIKKELANKKSVTYDFANSVGNYCEIRFVKLEDIDMEPHFVAFTFADKDEEIRRDKEYEESLHTAIKNAESANKAKSEFLFAMSHDIRTPMNAIVGFTNMADKYIDDKEKVSEYLGKVQSSSQQLLNLINDILDMSRIESGNVTIDEKPHNLRSLTKKFFDIYLFTASEKDLDFTMNYNCEHDDILCDELRLSRIFMNVVSNSIKYTKSGGFVTFTISEESNDTDNSSRYIFTVKDNGIGMSKDFLEHVFESFTREQTSTTSGIQGTGLGMSITKSLVDLMHGDISVESELGKGTTVTISIDFKHSDDTSDNFSYENINKSTGTLNGRRVLLVEDNDLNREIAKDTLEEEGLIVDEACDGTEAVEIIKGLDDALYYDIILMDIQMPIMDGYKATRTIRALKDVPNIDTVPIVAMTANAFEEDKQKAFDCGMNDHLAKPIDIQILKSTLQKYIK